MVTANNATLLLHRGSRKVTPEELLEISAPQPTRSWHPIPHYRVLDSARSAIEQTGFKVTRMELGVSRDDHKFFGVLDLASTIVEGVMLAVGVRNSTDKSLPAGIAAGERVLVCDNLAFSAQIVVMRKHTTYIERELDQRILDGITRLPAFQENAAGRIRRLQETPMDNPGAHDLIVRAVDERCIGLRDLPKVLERWRSPGYEAFGPRTAWSLYNAFTEVAKDRFERQPTTTAAQSIRLNRLFGTVLN
ncbi:MAG: DUF945 domain-containing protein [Planctomycetaceae bacterium]|nr:DUF945 domain-containing protein [Planctomycetaceae bacterium]